MLRWAVFLLPVPWRSGAERRGREVASSQRSWARKSSTAAFHAMGQSDTLAAPIARCGKGRPRRRAATSMLLAHCNSVGRTGPEWLIGTSVAGSQSAESVARKRSPERDATRRPLALDAALPRSVRRTRPTRCPVTTPPATLPAPPSLMTLIIAGPAVQASARRGGRAGLDRLQSARARGRTGSGPGFDPFAAEADGESARRLLVACNRAADAITALGALLPSP